MPERDLKVVTPSRYAALARTAERQLLAGWAAEVAEVMAEAPSCVGLVNVAIEVELAAGGQGCDGLLGDWSPFAQAEFVDWARHRGAYAEGAQHAGEGAPAGVVGPWVSREGARRSRFYSHPSHAEAPEGRPSSTPCLVPASAAGGSPTGTRSYGQRPSRTRPRR